MVSCIGLEKKCSSLLSCSPALVGGRGRLLKKKRSVNLSQSWSLCVLGGVNINIDKLIHTVCIYRHMWVSKYL